MIRLKISVRVFDALQGKPDWLILHTPSSDFSSRWHIPIFLLLKFLKRGLCLGMQRCLASGINDLEVCYTCSGCRGVVVIDLTFSPDEHYDQCSAENATQIETKIIQAQPETPILRKIDSQSRNESNAHSSREKIFLDLEPKNSQSSCKKRSQIRESTDEGEKPKFPSVKVKAIKEKQKGAMVKTRVQHPRLSKTFGRFLVNNYYKQ